MIHVVFKLPWGPKTSSAIRPLLMLGWVHDQCDPDAIIKNSIHASYHSAYRMSGSQLHAETWPTHIDSFTPIHNRTQLRRQRNDGFCWQSRIGAYAKHTLRLMTCERVREGAESYRDFHNTLLSLYHNCNSTTIQVRTTTTKNWHVHFLLASNRVEWAGARDTS